MASRKRVKATTKELSRGNQPVRRRNVPRSLFQSIPVRTLAITVGIAGLAALAIALVGPRRLRDDFMRPISEAALMPLAAAVSPQADRVWAETRPWRDQVGRVLSSVNTSEVRDLIAQRLTRWIDRFR